MCIIAVIPKGKKITEETFYTMWENNPDGAGMLYSYNGKLTVQKELLNPDALWIKYVKATALNVPIMLHFRIGTSGAMDEYNIHPFKVSDHLYFAHNGILSIQVPKDSKENDTQIFNNSILKNLPSGFIHNKGIMSLIKTTIGSGNKFVFYDSKGNIKIVNKSAGIVKDGIWYSNRTFEAMVYTKYFSTKWDNETEGVIGGKWNYPTHKRDECECCGNLTSTLKFNREYNANVCTECDNWILDDRIKNDYLWQQD